TAEAGAFVNGAAHQNSGPPLPVTNPADGQVFAEVASATAADVDAAVSSASEAFREWSELAVSRRGELLWGAATVVHQHVDELVELLTREQGKTLRDSRIEIGRAVETLE